MSRRLAAALLIVAAGACTSGTDGTIVVSDQGADVALPDPAAPPVHIDRDGIHAPPTPVPDRITPVIPVATPAPTVTPRPA